MKRLAVLVAATILTAVLPLHASASATTMVRGGGAGTFGADLDDDGDIDGSRFGLGVAILGGGSAGGHFLCLMAGDSDILGLPVMSVSGRVTEGTSGPGGSATFEGTATVNIGNGVIFRGVPFRVQVTAGGPGSGTIRLTVIGAFDGVPGDTISGNGNYDLPVETVSKGQISIATS